MCDTTDKYYWLSSLTTDGYRMKDKTSTQTYYKEYKKRYYTLVREQNGRATVLQVIKC